MSGSDQTNKSDDLSKRSMEAATQLLSQGKAQIQAGRFADAKGLLERLLTDYPNHSEALYFISVAQRLSDDYEGALGSLQKLIATMTLKDFAPCQTVSLQSTVNKVSLIVEFQFKMPCLRHYKPLLNNNLS